jgi:hypothetical protein
MVLLVALGMLVLVGGTVAGVRQHFAARSGHGPILLRVKDFSKPQTR